MSPGSLHVSLRVGGDSLGKATILGGRRLMQQPRGLRVASDGSLLVADFGSHCVLRFHPGDVRGQVAAGTPRKPLQAVDPLKDIDRPLGPAEGEGFLLMRPVDVCEDGQGGLFVLDTETCRLQYFPGDGRQATTCIPPMCGAPQKSSHGAEAIKNPRSFILEDSGDMVLCDTWSHRILRYTKDGGQPPEVLAGTPNSCGRRPDQLAFPSCIAFDKQGRLLVTDTNNHRVQCFTLGEQSGTTIVGSQSCVHGAGLSDLNMPTGLCVDTRDGSIIVADRGNARVLRFAAGSQAGDAGEVLAGPELLEHPWSVCLDAQGALYISDERRGTVVKLHENQDVPEFLHSSLDDKLEASSLEEPAVPQNHLVLEASVDAQRAVTVSAAEAPELSPAPTSQLVQQQPTVEISGGVQVSGAVGIHTFISDDPMELD